MLSSMKRMARRLALVGVAAVTLAIMSSSAKACLAYIGTNADGSGTILVLTCGSSAGDGFWECPPNGGPCTGSTDPSADFLCAMGWFGCGDSTSLKGCKPLPRRVEDQRQKQKVVVGNGATVLIAKRH